jgi:hypothetical protein
MRGRILPLKTLRKFGLQGPRRNGQRVELVVKALAGLLRYALTNVGRQMPCVAPGVYLDDVSPPVLGTLDNVNRQNGHARQGFVALANRLPNVVVYFQRPSTFLTRRRLGYRKASV